jgi:hypothetical protein
MKNLSERIADYKGRIELDLALITDARAWVIARYPEVTVVNLKGEPVYSSFPLDAQQMLADLNGQEVSVRTMVAEALGLTLEQAGGKQ